MLCSKAGCLWQVFLLQRGCMNGLFSWYMFPCAQLHVWVLGKGSNINWSIFCPVLFFFFFWKVLFCFSNFCFYFACSPFSLVERKRLQWKRFICFVFYPGKFSNVTDSAAPQTVWLVQWRRAISGAGVGPSRGELLNSALLPGKCLYNYTINVVFMLTLCRAY